MDCLSFEYYYNKRNMKIGLYKDAKININGRRNFNLEAITIDSSNNDDNENILNDMQMKLGTNDLYPFKVWFESYKQLAGLDGLTLDSKSIENIVNKEYVLKILTFSEHGKIKSVAVIGSYIDIDGFCRTCLFGHAPMANMKYDVAENHSLENQTSIDDDIDSVNKVLNTRLFTLREKGNFVSARTSDYYKNQQKGNE